jgi:hypothetical protein
MFEIVRAIHEALGTESTFVFVLVVVLVFGSLSGGAAYIVDKGYKNARTGERQSHERHLTSQQVVGLTQMADNFPKKAFLYVRVPTNDVEAQNYGKEIWAAFEGKVSGSLVWGSGGSPSDGLIVASGSFSNQNPGYVANGLICIAFSQLGIPFDSSNDFNLNGAPIGLDQTYILVGRNPK